MKSIKTRKDHDCIAVGMSGGVDSSVAALALTKEGHDVVGITFRMWPKEECSLGGPRPCCNLESLARARVVAEELGIPYHLIDLSREFKSEVIDYFCREYLKGLTPNPCVVCNEKIKFSILLKEAKAFGASRIATGHFARVKELNGRSLLREGRDKAKDQSYFLFRLTQEQLKCASFPLGDMTKDEVRDIAREHNLVTSHAVSSQDICFVQDLDYAKYIQKKTGVHPNQGDIVDAGGKVLGRHDGILHYTIGQRRGLGIAYSEPLYVTGIDVKANKVIVGTKKDVLSSSLVADRLNWISIEKPEGPFKAKAKIRYNAKKADCTVTPAGKDEVRVDFDLPQEAPTPGQAVVFYDDDIVIGGGWIK